VVRPLFDKAFEISGLAEAEEDTKESLAEKMADLKERMEALDRNGGAPEKNALTAGPTTSS
jgi:hypothetical protein